MSLQYFEGNFFFFNMSFYLNIVWKNIVSDVGLMLNLLQIIIVSNLSDRQ